MAMNLWSSIFSTVTTIWAYYPVGPEDFSNKHLLESVFVILTVVPLIPLVAAILAMITKWLIVRIMFTTVKWSGIVTLCTIGIAEVFCLLVAMLITWRLLLGIYVAPYITLVSTCLVYGMLAMFPNFLLFQSVIRRDGYRILHKSLFAFAIGFVYLGYVFLVLWLIPILIPIRVTF